MYRSMKWIAPIAGLALLVCFQLTCAKADDTSTTAPAGKATVNVTVVDGDNKPVAGAKVQLLPPKPKKGKKAPPADGAAAAPAKGGTKAVPIAQGTTDAEGKVALPGIADGDYLIQARSKAVGSGRGNTTITDGQDASVSITLMPRAGAAAGATTQPAPAQ
jgi:Carboxypeptidase regulatory-like domain